MAMIEHLVTPPIVDDAECPPNVELNELRPLGPAGDRELSTRAPSCLDLPDNEASWLEDLAEDLVAPDPSLLQESRLQIASVVSPTGTETDRKLPINGVSLDVDHLGLKIVWPDSEVLCDLS